VRQRHTLFILIQLSRIFMQGKTEYSNNKEEIQASLRKAREFLECFSESVYHQWVKEFFMERSIYKKLE
jgi:hypothetical protein